MSHTAEQTSKNSCGRLMVLLSRQKYLIDQIGTLAERQEAIVRAENAEALLEVLGNRQQLIDRVLAAQAEVSALTAEFERDAAARSAMSEDDRRKIHDLMAGIESGLSRVLHRDDEDRELISAMRERAKSELSSFGQARHARRAYMTQSSGTAANAETPRFSDSKG